MSEQTITIIKKSCDVCGYEITIDNEDDERIKKFRMPVSFTTDQTEGLPCKPYIFYETIDLCEECSAKAVTLLGMGAQGYNSYRFKK